VTAAGIVAVDGYAISSSTDNGATWNVVTLNTGSSATSYVVTGLTDPGPYLFRVAAVVDNVVGEWTLIAGAVSPKVAPRAPSTLTAVPGNARAALTWTTPADGGAPISGYALYTSPNGTTWLPVNAAVAPGASSYTVTGLSNGRAYAFRVAAVNAVGVGLVAQSASVTPFTKAGMVTKVVAVSRVKSAMVTWRAPSNGGSAIVGYQIDVRRLPSTTWKVYVRTTGSAATARTVTRLLAGVGYQFRVKAITKAGVAPVSAPSTVVKPFAAPGAPTHVTGRVSGHKVYLSWSAPAVGGPRITGYQVAYSHDGGRTWTVAITSTKSARTRTTVSVHGTDDLYVFRLRALTALGAGGWSARSNRLAA
jgi:titin